MGVTEIEFMITIYRSRYDDGGGRGDEVARGTTVDEVLERVTRLVVTDEPELMSLAEDLRFIKNPPPGEQELQSGFILVVD